MSDRHRTRDPSTYRGGGADPELLSELRRQEWAQRTPREKQRHLRAFIVAGQRSNKKSSRTAIEMSVAQMLNDLRIAFQQNVQLGRYNVDFLIGKTIVECFGDFWHCNPLMWEASDVNRSLRLTAGEKWQRDRERRTRLEARGYGFVSFWESEIRQTPELVRARLQAMQKDADDAAQD